MFSPAKRAIDPHSPNTPLASPGEPLPTYPIWRQPNDPVAGSKTRDRIRYRMTARRARANARGACVSGFDNANRTLVFANHPRERQRRLDDVPVRVLTNVVGVQRRG